MKRLGGLLLAGALVTACAPEAQPQPEAETSPAGSWLPVREVMRAGTFEASGVAEPSQEATLSPS
jgi:hypothetical protein